MTIVPRMPHVVTLVPGDGTGPELTEATRRVLEATGVEFTWDVQQAGVDVMETAGTPLPPETLASIKTNGVALKGPITTPIGTGFRSVNVALRHELGLYACVRPCKTYPGVRSRYDAVDLVVIRENTEDLYAGIEFESGTDDAQAVIDFLNARQPKQILPTSGISIKPLSPEGSERIIRFAFEYARANGRRRVSCITKANIMKHTDGLFLAVFREVAKDYPDIEAWETLVDALCMGLVQRPGGVRRAGAAEPLRRHRLRTSPPASSAGSASRRARTSARGPRSSRRRTARRRSTRGRTASTRRR